MRPSSHAAQQKHHKTSWEPVAGWYKSYMGSEGGALQREVVFPGALHLLAPSQGKTYLDLACGQGAFARLIGKKATVVGIDASPSLIAEAKKQATPKEKFFVGDATNFTNLVQQNSIDGMVCILAIQNIDAIEKVFSESARVLKSGAPFVIVMNHPSFRPPQQSGWGWDEKRKLQYRRVDRYLSKYETAIIAHPGNAPSIKTTSYHRPLQTYVAALAKNGLVIDALEEWVSNKVSDSGPKAKAENVAREEFPMFLALRARKM